MQTQLVLEIDRYKISQTAWPGELSRKIIVHLEGYYRGKMIQSPEYKLQSGAQLAIPWSYKLDELILKFYYIDDRLKVELGTSQFAIPSSMGFNTDGEWNKIILDIIPHGGSERIGRMLAYVNIQKLFEEENEPRTIHSKSQYHNETLLTNHNIPGFRFRRLSKAINWNRLKTIDIEKIIDTRDTRTIERCIDDVALGDAAEEDCDPRLLRTLQLAQFSAQYLIQSQNFFKGKRDILKEALNTFQDEEDLLDLKITKLKARKKAMKREIEEMDRIAESYYTTLKAKNPDFGKKALKAYRKNTPIDPINLSDDEDDLDPQFIQEIAKQVMTKRKETKKNSHPLLTSKGSSKYVNNKSNTVDASEEENNNIISLDNSKWKNVRNRNYDASPSPSPSLSLQQSKNIPSPIQNNLPTDSSDDEPDLPHFLTSSTLQTTSQPIRKVVASRPVVVKSISGSKDPDQDINLKSEINITQSFEPVRSILPANNNEVSPTIPLNDQPTKLLPLNTSLKLSPSSENITRSPRISAMTSRLGSQSTSPETNNKDVLDKIDLVLSKDRDVVNPAILSSTSRDRHISSNDYLSSKDSSPYLTKITPNISPEPNLSRKESFSEPNQQKVSPVNKIDLLTATAATEITLISQDSLNIPQETLSRKPSNVSIISRTHSSEVDLLKKNPLEPSSNLSQTYPLSSRPRTRSNLEDEDEEDHEENNYNDSNNYSGESFESPNRQLDNMDSMLSGSLAAEELGESFRPTSFDISSTNESITLAPPTLVTTGLFIPPFKNNPTYYEEKHADSIENKQLNQSNAPAENKETVQSIQSLPSLPSVQSQQSELSKSSEAFNEYINDYEEEDDPVFGNSFSNKRKDNWHSHLNEVDTSTSVIIDFDLPEPSQSKELSSPPFQSRFLQKNDTKNSQRYSLNKAILDDDIFSSGPSTNEYEDDFSSPVLKLKGNMGHFENRGNDDDMVLMGTNRFQSNTPQSFTDSQKSSSRPNMMTTDTFDKDSLSGTQHTDTNTQTIDRKVNTPTNEFDELSYDSILGSPGKPPMHTTNRDIRSNNNSGKHDISIDPLNNTAEEDITVMSLRDHNNLTWDLGRAPIELIELASAFEIQINALRLNSNIFRAVKEVYIDLEFLEMKSDPSQTIVFKPDIHVQPIAYYAHMTFSENVQRLLVQEIRKSQENLACTVNIMSSVDNKLIGHAMIELWTMIENNCNILRQEVDIFTPNHATVIGSMIVDVRGHRLFVKCSQ